MKFGGGILCNNEAYAKIAKILEKNSSRENVLVVSAHKGVTDLLLETFEKHSKKKVLKAIEKIREKHLFDGVDKKKIEKKLVQLQKKLEKCNANTLQKKEEVSAWGEKLSALSLASYLKNKGFKAKPVESEEAGIITDGVMGNAACNIEKTTKNLSKYEKDLEDGALVLTGYYGVDSKGRTTTFGRGGTDYSAGFIARCLNANLLEIWKNVDGFMSCDPKLLKCAVKLDEISFLEAKELGYFGAAILHPRTFDYLENAKTKVVVKNIFKPNGKGTKIVRKKNNSKHFKQLVTSVGVKRNIAVVDVEGTNLSEQAGGAAKIFSSIASRGISIDGISTAQVNISFTVDDKDADSALEALNALGQKYVQKASCKKNMALIGIVGEELMHSSSHAAGITFPALEKAGVSVKMISQSASGIDLSFLVKEQDVNTALNALHEKLWG